ncbi:hypothetical protein NCC78_12205 [Micromonospora phytophila]|uniref:hypothetical protein n=1 Tax=Micromonospora phytophila TaxID=709888 RepID=UPI00202FA187|nr:hypothetical protein [Micromonospora phytophila]MCM0675445.1 hypothetical protein [Micromonospora phytophila]
MLTLRGCSLVGVVPVVVRAVTVTLLPGAAAPPEPARPGLPAASIAPAAARAGGTYRSAGAVLAGPPEWP